MTGTATTDRGDPGLERQRAKRVIARYGGIVYALASAADPENARRVTVAALRSGLDDLTMPANRWALEEHVLLDAARRELNRLGRPHAPPAPEAEPPAWLEAAVLADATPTGEEGAPETGSADADPVQSRWALSQDSRPAE